MIKRGMVAAIWSRRQRSCSGRRERATIRGMLGAPLPYLSFIEALLLLNPASSKNGRFEDSGEGHVSPSNADLPRPLYGTFVETCTHSGIPPLCGELERCPSDVLPPLRPPRQLIIERVPGGYKMFAIPNPRRLHQRTVLEAPGV